MTEAAPPNSRIYLEHIETYDKSFEKWRVRARKILERYKDNTDQTARLSNLAHFNILWSNVQTLKAATFAKVPKPDVSRRFADNDAVGRVASLILERGLTYEIEQYPDYRTTLEQCVLDRFLPGRGTAWARYEPHMRAMQSQLPTDGLEVTEDVDEPGEELDYECAPVDYVHWRDFGHTVARTWEEVTAVWRICYLTEQAAKERFPDKNIPLENIPDADDSKQDDKSVKARAKIYEIWDKESKQAIWLHKSLGILDVKDDPLGLTEFFPCPKPIYATLTSDSLEPLPDFTLYQDQAAELDTLADRIDGLIKALKVRGVYDASIPALSRLLDEGDSNALIPVTNWMAFAEKGGLSKSFDMLDIQGIAACLEYAYKAFEQVKNQIYEITGISDIIRGQTLASETATAQSIKGQYASLRLKSYQDEVARFATDLLRLKAQIMCGKFAPETLLKMASADQLSEADQQAIPQAMQLLLGQRVMMPDSDSPNPLRAFRIEVAADTLVQMDEQQEKQNRVEFLTAVGGFLQQAAQVAQVEPQTVPLIMEMLKFGVSGFKAGRQLEGTIDKFVDQFAQQAMQPKPPPPPDPKLQVAQLQAQTAQQVEPMRAQAEAAKAHAAVVQSAMDVQKARIEAATTAIPMGMQ